MNKKIKLLGALNLFVAHSVFALPEQPSIDRDVYMMETRDGEIRPQFTRPTIPTLQTTADGRVGISHKLQENGRVAFRLQVPEKLEQAFVNSEVGTGTDILSKPNALADSNAVLYSNQIQGDASSHLGLCDPAFDETSNIKNPMACGVDNADDCYTVTIIRSERDDNNADLRTIFGTPVTIRVSNPKTADAEIVEVTAGTAVQGATFELNSFLEPMTTSDGRLLFVRVGAGTEITWRDSQNVSHTSKSDNIYFVNDNPESQTACDVTQWDKPYPLGHAPYDTTINQRYGFAMQLFRDTANNVIPDGNPIGTYPWIDKEGDNITITAVGTSLYDTKTGESLYPARCLESVNECVDDLDAQNGSALNGRVIMGLWTRGKMVLLDNLINNIDFTLHADDGSQREVQLYQATSNFDGYTRVGSGRDNREELLPLASSGNTTFFDSNEHRFNYLEHMKPVTPADVSWLVSSGRGTTEMAFDDYLNPNSFINANMAQVVELRSNGGRITLDGKVQNAATAGRVLPESNASFAEPEWNIPLYGDILGDGRIEPIAKGGINGKGFWLSGNSSGIEFSVPAQTRDIQETDWYYSLFLDMRGSQTGDKTLIRFPDNSEIRVRNANRLVYFDSTGNQVRLINTRNVIPTNAWTHIGIQATNNNRTITTYINGFRVNLFTHSDSLFEMQQGELTLGHSQTTDSSNFIGWIDDFKVMAERVNVEMACNHANGTLVGLDSAAPVDDTQWHYWNDYADSMPAGSHNAIRNTLNTRNKPSYDKYVCYSDYSADYAAHLANIPAGLHSIRDSINFPEGPLLWNAPRPDSSNNAFCLSCHTAGGMQGLDIDALTLNNSLDAVDDPRRQPMQPDAKVFGNIPANWLGQGIPAEHFIADPVEGFSIDRLVLASTGEDTDTSTPNQPENIVNLSTLVGNSGNWVNATIGYALDDNSDNSAEEAVTQVGERGANSSPVWLEFDFGAVYQDISFTLKEDNSNPEQVSRWKIQTWDNASNAWLDVTNWQASSNQNLQTYSVTFSASQVRVLLQAPSGQTVGLQEINAVGVRQSL
ncbi:LamG-like jellyroll fold domain-containing protein [Catenovulum maritimum]|uniref:F5/8 type C domain-containing protein n=1 Tax=Catenovulum maritimum TaxID=1513271 RepID=A0A0J8GWC3_9ALTE|nr:LamG-like jellyroll fold domain-containing protein [Catenovulum maritimum]KMT67070.1 hypothetical protein XM47_00290 [Catenovulum maritimum]